ncbi:unnamed protein product [Symbiodinium natans]|uniref:Uncharacterized protein n=1 Tax=Symbiodinium natans TaxID=878477 RepID=A0A812P7J2_9DINO|nr:unnamed protein product [Symbiodinium natans]
MEEQMWELRAVNFRYGAMVLCHLDLLCALVLVWQFLQSPCVSLAFLPVGSMCTYSLSICFASGRLAPSRKFLLFANFVLVPLASLGVWNPEEHKDAAGLQFSLVAVGHMTAAVLYLDITIYVPSAVLHTLVSIATFIYFRGSSQLNSAVVFCHVVQLLMRIMVLSLIEMAVRSYLGSNQKLEEAHCMIAGFQQILKGMCDGSLLLDEQLRVHGPTSSLQQLLMDRKDFAGIDFESLIMDAQGREQFAAFIQASCAAAGEPAAMSAPSCLRLALKSGSGGIAAFSS